MVSLVLFVAALFGPAAALLANSSYNSQVRLAYSGPTAMVVSWNTFVQLSQPTVLYGLTADNLKYSASSEISITYQSSSTYNNHVKLTGLTPDTTYYYMPQNLLPNETSPGPYTFKTAKPAGVFDPYTVAYVCDLGTMGSEGLSTTAGKGVDANQILKPGEQNTINSLVEEIGTYDFLLHPGDIAYADYWLKEELGDYEPNTTIADGYKVYESILNEFYDQMEAVTATRPWLVGAGNHEANCDNGGSGPYTASICVPGQQNFTGYINHFRMPSDVSGGVGNFWYSFDYGMVHYVFFDTETDLGNGLVGPDEPAPMNAGPFGAYPNAQIDWLAKDLAGVDRCQTPWVIALGHRPWFSSGSVCANCSLAFANVLEQYGVDMVLQGHFHVYERNLPIFANGTLDPNGYDNPSTPWYLINGIAGHYSGMDTFTYPLEEYQAYGLDDSNATYGWSKITFYNQTHLLHEFVASNNNSVLDSTVLYKAHEVCGPAKNTTTTSSATVSLATSTVKTTTLVTVTRCPATVTDCPVGSTVVETSTVDLYTTVCPASEVSATTVPAVKTSAPPYPTTSAVTSTKAVVGTTSYTTIAPGTTSHLTTPGAAQTTGPVIAGAGKAAELVSAVMLWVAGGIAAAML